MSASSDLPNVSGAVKGEPTFAGKGSQRWLQIAVNRRPEVLDRALREAAALGGDIEWLSPLATERFAEYSDNAMLARLGVEPKVPLARFWPVGGPRWDGLARAASGDVFLVEAKAHIGEMVSGGCRATEPALSMIRASLEAVKRDLLPKAGEVDWSGAFYQYANRLAHLHFLRVQNGIPAHLVFVYFLNAEEMGGPSEVAEYRGAIRVIEQYLGLGRHRLGRFVHKVFVDVRELEG
jgi:hypothetical protein